MLAACSSTTTSVREVAGETQQQIAEVETGEIVAAAEEVPAQSMVDFSIAANLDEISEKTQRSYDEALAAMRSENWVQAELALQQLIEDEPGFPGLWVNLALVYQRDGRAAEARQALEQAIAIAPGFAPANNELGRILREHGDFTGAQSAYERSLASDPNNAIAHLNLGILLDIYLRRPADALNHYSQYQATLSEPDQTVSRWIVDLERRVQAEARVAQD
jgi:tetratricopeptide (TPR) repeat protein